jgi:hypothetical protein
MSALDPGANVRYHGNVRGTLLAPGSSALDGGRASSDASNPMPSPPPVERATSRRGCSDRSPARSKTDQAARALGGLHKSKDWILMRFSGVDLTRGFTIKTPLGVDLQRVLTPSASTAPAPLAPSLFLLAPTAVAVHMAGQAA